MIAPSYPSFSMKIFLGGKKIFLVFNVKKKKKKKTTKHYSHENDLETMQ